MKKISTLILLLFSLFSNAQINSKADSLIRNFSESESDQEKFKAANSLCSFYRTSNPETSIYYGDIALDLAIKLNSREDITEMYNLMAGVYLGKGNYLSATTLLNTSIELCKKWNDEKGLATNFNTLGNVYYRQSDFDKAIDFFNKALEIRLNTNDKKKTAAVYNNLGSVYESRGDYALALENHLNSLKIKEELNDSKGIAVSYNNIANVYKKQKNFRQALEYHIKSLQQKEKADDKRGLSITLCNIANVYYEMGDTVTTISYYEKALAIQKDVKDDMTIANIYNNLGRIYGTKGSFRKADRYLKQALQLRNKLNDKKGIASTYANYGVVYQQIGNDSKAMEYYQKSLVLATEIEDKSKMEEANQSIATLYAKQKEYKKSLEYLQKSSSLKDSMFNTESAKQIAEMQTKYETEKKEKDIALLKKENELKDIQNRNQLVLSSSILLIIALSSGMIYLNNRQKQKRKLTEELLKQEKFRLRSIITTQEEERKRISAELHDGIGQLLSTVKLNVSSLEDSFHKEVNVQERYNLTLQLIDRSCAEIRTISHSMMPAVLTRSGLAAAIYEFVQPINTSGKMKVFLDTQAIPDGLSEEINLHVYRVVQELVNNTIKYADASEIHIQFDLDKKELSLTVEDNGVGFDKNKIEQNKGNGWANIISRLNLIQATYEVESAPGKGVVTHIYIPI